MAGVSAICRSDHMSTIYDILFAREAELRGKLAFAEEIDCLRSLGADHIPGLVETFRGLAVCGMIVAFSVGGRGGVTAPLTLDTDDYDPAHDHEFYWMTPTQSVEELTGTATGAAILAAEFVPIGMCTFGGDYYYLKRGPQPGTTIISRLYRDWIDPTAAVPVPSEAIGVVSASFEDVLRAAAFRPGL